MVGALLLAVLQAVAVAQAQNAFYEASGMSGYMEEKLDEWSPATSYLTPPGTTHNEPDDLVGLWQTEPGGYDSASIFFSKREGNTYTVLFRTGGCLAFWKLQRTATLVDGVIALNKAVEPYSGDAFDRLFFVKRNGHLTLVPAGASERAQDLSSSGSSDVGRWIDYFSYRNDYPSQ